MNKIMKCLMLACALVATAIVVPTASAAPCNRGSGEPLVYCFDTWGSQTGSGDCSSATSYSQSQGASVGVGIDADSDGRAEIWHGVVARNACYYRDTWGMGTTGSSIDVLTGGNGNEVRVNWYGAQWFNGRTCQLWVRVAIVPAGVNQFVYPFGGPGAFTCPNGSDRPPQLPILIPDL